ncbi:MAG: 3-isopropylmalate dehydratase small subunit [Pantoea sp. Brub]|nr:3-isopropylmalate dehydratase small subunit [Pantoea sp. Brub]
MSNNFVQHIGIVAPLNIANIDTDTIIPKQFLQNVSRINFGQYLFYNWRYKDPLGKVLNKNFVLNKLEFKAASILLTRENFGCGSSREHALWALIDFGIRIIIAPSFSDIFYENSFNNQLLSIQLNKKDVNDMFSIVNTMPGIECIVDIVNMNIKIFNKIYYFKLNEIDHKCFIEGIDKISVTMQNELLIEKYEKSQHTFMF